MLSEDLLTAPAEAVVIPMDAACMPSAVKTATVLRENGIRTQVYFEDKKFKQKISYADKTGIPFALIIGETEVSSDTAAVKDLRSGVQESLSPEAAAARIIVALKERREGRLIRE